MHRYGPAIGAMVVVLLAAAGCGREKEVVLARVSQKAITERDLWRALETADDRQRALMTLDQLIVHELVRQEAKKRGIEVTREELKARVDGQRDYRLAQSCMTFEEWLEDTGQTEDDVVRQIAVQMLTAKMVLDDDTRRGYFEKHKQELAELPHNGESVIFRHIVVATKDEADAIRRELTAEEAADFVEIAKARSLDPLTGPRGGMVGWVMKGKVEDEELEKVLFGLKEGEVSEPLPIKLSAPSEEEGEEEEQQAGSQQQPPQWWHIVKVEKHIPPHEITYEDNEDVVEEWLLNEPEYRLQLHEFWNNLRAKADVEIVAPRYRALADAYRRGREERERRMGGPSAPIAPLPQVPEGAPTLPQEGESAEPPGE